MDIERGNLAQSVGFEAPPVIMNADFAQSAQIGSSDRFITTLLFAILVHGVLILGLGFAAEPPQLRSPLSSKLEVTMVTGRETAPAEDPDYLAQINQSGRGNTREQHRPSQTARTTAVNDNPGIEQARDLDHRLVAETPSADPNSLDDPERLAARQSITQNRQPTRKQLSSLQSAALDPASHRQVARLMIRDNAMPLIDEERSDLAEITDDRPAEKRVSVNTKSSVYAPYLHAWRKKIERIGTLNFPDEVLRQGLYGDVTMEVVIAEDGSLADADVLVRSPHRTLDEAALRIVRLAAPFQPFSDEMKQASAQIRFIWKWRFLPGEDNVPRQTGKVYADG